MEAASASEGLLERNYVPALAKLRDLINEVIAADLLVDNECKWVSLWKQLLEGSEEELSVVLDPIGKFESDEEREKTAMAVAPEDAGAEDKADEGADAKDGVVVAANAEYRGTAADAFVTIDKLWTLLDGAFDQKNGVSGTLVAHFMQKLELFLFEQFIVKIAPKKGQIISPKKKRKRLRKLKTLKSHRR